VRLLDAPKCQDIVGMFKRDNPRYATANDTGDMTIFMTVNSDE